MDRNLVGCIDRTIDIVALRKESVDRNSFLRPSRVGKNPSLSARRAWIEIIAPGTSVFRGWSLSARRAWIEIAMPKQSKHQTQTVALRKESVDRNGKIMNVLS